ncbi:MAG TPA: hypothetical protein VN541_04260 [Tepidisphaeraceae bacterium]|nr:hypothetical protein [Tepidisphaeraceae bacterium]
MLRTLMMALVLAAFTVVMVGCHGSVGGSVGGNSTTSVGAAR